MGFLSYGMIQSLALIGQEQVFLNLFFLALACLFLFQSVFSCINVFYFSKDVEIVLPLPLKPYQIILAKLNTILVTEYITEMIFGFVPLTIYGVLTGAGFLYYFMTIIALVVFPILPLLVVSVIVMLIMSFAKLTKYKDKFQMIVGVISILLVIGIQFFAIGSNEELTEEQVAEKLMQANGMVDLIGDYFITLKPITRAMTEATMKAAIIEMAKAIAFTAIAGVIVVWIGQKVYLRGAVGSSTGGGITRRKIEGEKAYRKQLVGISYVKKEFKILVRNPVFFMQCILPAILMPVLFLVILLAGGNSGAEEMQLDEMIKSIEPFVIILVVTGILQFLSMMIYIATTAVSRDGKNAIFMKYIPLSLHRQFIYKMIPNVIMNVISMLIVFVLVYIVLPIPIWQYVVIFILGLLFAIMNSYLNLFVDLRRPKLEWDTEYAVVKQNMNMMWTMLYGLLEIGFLVGVGALYAVLHTNGILAIGALMILLCLVIWLCDRHVSKKQNELFAKIF